MDPLAITHALGADAGLQTAGCMRSIVCLINLIKNKKMIAATCYWTAAHSVQSIRDPPEPR